MSLLVFTLIFPLLGAITLSLFPRMSYGAARTIGTASVGLSAATFALVAVFWSWSGGFPFIQTLWKWIDAGDFQVNFSLYLDGLSLTFALLVTGIGALIVLYAGGYLKGHEDQGRFFSFILMFMGSMLGLVVADSFLTLFVFWELTSITSFLLIGFDHSREASRRAALQALVVTGLGGLSLLAGLLVIWSATGVTSMSALLASESALRDAPLLRPPANGFFSQNHFVKVAILFVC